MSYCTNSIYPSVSLRAWQDDLEPDDLPWDEDGTQLGLCVVCGRGDALDDAGQCYDCLTTAEAALLELAPPPHYHDNTTIPAVQLRAAWLLARDSPYEGWVGLFSEQSEFANWSCHSVTHAASQAQVSGPYPRLYRIGAALMVQLADMTCWAVYPDGDSKLLF